MDDIWQRLKDYVEPLTRWLGSTGEVNNSDLVLMFLFLVLTLVAMLYFGSARHVERQVSRRKQRARHRQMLEEATQTITVALEARVQTGDLKREELDKKIYPLLRKAGLKEVGTEPTFGKPWYVPLEVPDVGKLKRSIYTRLHQMGVDVAAKLRRRKPANRMEEIRAAIKLKKPVQS